MKHVRLKRLLYLSCLIVDFSAFVVIFVVTRRLAEQTHDTWYLGIFGAALAFSAGMASLLSGWLSSRFDSRIVFVSGSLTVSLAVVCCASGDTATITFLPQYCLFGIGLGFIYPTLIGWLNRNEDVQVNHRGMSRTLILYCVSWNVGMMCGQLTAGSLFEKGVEWLYGLAFAASVVNVFLSIAAARLVTVRPHDSVTDNSDEGMVTAGDRLSGSDPPNLKIAANFKRLSWIANLGVTFGVSLVIHLLPDLVVTIGIAADSHGVLVACGRVVVIATYLLMHVGSFWHYRFSISLASQLLGLIGLLVIAWADSAVILYLGLILHSQLVGYNYFSGLFYSTAGSSHDRRTLAAGIHEATLSTGMAAGTLAGGVLGTIIGQRAPYVLAAVVLGVVMVVQTIAWCRWFVFTRADSTGPAAESVRSEYPGHGWTGPRRTNGPKQDVAVSQLHHRRRQESDSAEA